MKDKHPSKDQRDERVKLPFDPDDALRALLAVKPEDEPVDDEEAPAK